MSLKKQNYISYIYNSLLEYIDLVVKQLSYIPENIVIERLTGDGNISDLVAPLWSIRKVTILNDIDKLMVAKDYYQGCKIKKPI